MALGHFRLTAFLYPEVPESADFVMYWWHIAAEAVRSGATRRFGFIATNSLRQTFNRRVLSHHMQNDKPLSLIYTIPDHPWVDSRDGANVRISMSVAQAGRHEGTLARVVAETVQGDHIAVDILERAGIIHADLSIGPNVAAAMSLKSNDSLSCRGVSLHGAGFMVTPEEAIQLGLGRIPGLERHIRETGYVLDSGWPYRLWFSFIPLTGPMNNRVIRCGFDRHSLLHQAEEELAATVGFSTVEPECELVEVKVEVLVTDCALMRSHEPSFEQRDDAMHPRQQFRGGLLLPFDDRHFMDVAFGVQAGVALPAIGMRDAARLDRLLHERM